MKKSILFLSILALQVIFAKKTFAQNGIITTVAGNGTYGGMMGGDGGPATAASLLCVRFAGIDDTGNIYIQESCTSGNQCIRKINPTGIITTIVSDTGSVFLPTYSGIPAINAVVMAPSFGMAVDKAGNIFIPAYDELKVYKIDNTGIIRTYAGGGSGGDGGPATAAEILYPMDVATDLFGNVYIVEDGMMDIRKVNSSGIISTVAGGGSLLGDGLPATAVGINPSYVKCDASGNLYISEYTKIRKVNTSGIISTIAGNGVAGFSGDGGPATAAQIRAYNMAIDNVGNIYFTDSTSRVRKISTSGIITTVAGNGIAGFDGDGGSAKNAELYSPSGLSFDGANNMYISDLVNSRLRKVTFVPNAVSDSISVLINKHCSGADFSVTIPHYHSGWTLKTIYGDGKSDTVNILSTFGGGYVNFSHVYDVPGTYTCRHILMNGPSIIDSVKYSYTYSFCRTLPFAFYYDYHGTCIYDSLNDPFLYLPVLVEIDSNSTPIDTISCTSGLFYDAKGNIGDVYSLKILSAPPGLNITCPYSGVVFDTLQETAIDTKYVGFNCSSIPGFDIGENVSFRTGRHQAAASILVYNSMCPPENASLTINFSSKYAFASSMPTPTSFTSSSVSWDLGGLSSTASHPLQILASFGLPTGVWLTKGDTINSVFTVVPALSGDIDASNNDETREDSVTGSYDPNEISVSPAGVIPSGTTLKYTINFENTGNDTAYNIHIMDTLSDNVDPMSLKISGASSTMNVYKYLASGHSVFKFDFPGINLLDSSHHNQCDGMLMFTINAKNGLPDGTTIFNHAGIFFDYNPPIVTNVVEDIIGKIDNVNGVANIGPTLVEVYPNPANEDLFIKMREGAYNSLVITDDIGQVFLKYQLNGVITKLDVKNLPSGLYYITLKGERDTKVQKFIKM